MLKKLKLVAKDIIKKESGFTLIEAIISVAIVAIIVVPFSVIFTKGLTTSIETKNQLRANQLAQEYVESYNRKTYLDITTDLTKIGSKYSKTIIDGDYSVEINFEELKNKDSGNDYEIDDEFMNTKITNFDGLVYFYNKLNQVNSNAYLYSKENLVGEVELKEDVIPTGTSKLLSIKNSYSLDVKEDATNIIYKFDNEEISILKTNVNYRIVMYLDDSLVLESAAPYELVINNELEDEKPIEIINYISARNKAKFNYDVQKGKVFISNEKSTELEYSNRIYQLNIIVSKDGVELENIATTVKAK